LSAPGKSSTGAAGIVDRARAALLGVAVGDALGATTEFMTPAEIRERYGVLREIVGGGWLKLSPGQVTDDTEMTLCVARGIARSKRWDLGSIADRFARWLSGGPADVGATCRRGIEEYMDKGRLKAPPDERGAGNGAAMRVAPVALYTLGDEEFLSRLAVEQAHITHHHPLSDAACVSVGTMIQRGLLGMPLPVLRAAAEELAARHPEFRFEGYDGESSAYVVDTLRTVFDAFFSTDTFEDCVVKTVNRGGGRRHDRLHRRRDRGRTVRVRRDPPGVAAGARPGSPRGAVLPRGGSRPEITAVRGDVAALNEEFPYARSRHVA